MVKRTVSEIMLLLLLIGIFALAFNIQPVKASGTIYIRADGSIDPPDAPISTVDNVTYTFMGGIYDEIVVERSNIIIDGDGYTVEGRYVSESKGIFLSGRSNVTVKNVAVKKFYYGIRLDGSSGNIIQGNTVTDNYHGIRLEWASNYNSISGNTITANNLDGIYLSRSNNNSVSGNNIANNYRGIRLESSSNYNIIGGNNITANNGAGIRLLYSSSNSISGNNIANSIDGIYLTDSSDNSISGNNITANNRYGIWLSWSSDNAIYHNNFVDNTEQVQSEYSTNIWDDGYPSGGNYWSDYEEKYPDASEINNSGVWDTPYVIDENNRDNYPIIPEFPSAMILSLFMVLTMLAVVFTKRNIPAKPKS